MIAALGFAPGNEGFGVVLVETADMATARTALASRFGRNDFIRVIILRSETPIEIVGNWREPFNFKNATLVQIEAVMS